jgi:ankyrin repeat protein
MDFILRDNVVHNKSSMLYWAAKKDLVVLAQRLLERGADIDTTYGLGVRAVTHEFSSTPLIMAVSKGQLHMVVMLLERGARHKACGMRTPVSMAIFKRNEDICLRLLRHLESVNGIQEVLCDDTLKEACTAKLVRVVQDLVERMGLDAEQAQLDEALFWAVRRSFGKERDDDTLKMASMLLKTGANPDVEFSWTPGQMTYTARELAYTYYRDNPEASALFWEGPETPWWGDKGECVCAHHSRYVKMHTAKAPLNT